MMDSKSVMKYMLALILLSGYSHCNPRQNDDPLYTLYNNRRGENHVIRVHPDRKLEPGYGYPTGDQEALYQLYNGGITQIDFPQPGSEVYVFRKDQPEYPIISGQPLPLQQIAVPPSPANEPSANNAQLQQQQKHLQQVQQLQPTQHQLALQNQQKQREQLTLQTDTPQQTANVQKAVADPLSTAVYGILIKQQPNPTVTKSSEENPTPTLHRPESQIVAQSIPQQQSDANTMKRLPSSLTASGGLPVLPPIFGVHNGVLGKVPLPFPNVPAYSISQYGRAPQKQPSIGNEYLSAPPSTPQKEANENLSLRLPNTQTNINRPLPHKVTSNKQLPNRNLGTTRTQLPPQPQTVYFDDEKEPKLTASVSYKNPVSRRPNNIPPRQPPNTPTDRSKVNDQLKLLSSYQNQERTRYQGVPKGALTPLDHTSSQQQELTKLSNHPTQLNSPSYIPQNQHGSFNYPTEKPYKEQSQINKPRIRNQNEQYPLGHTDDHLGISDEADFDSDDYPTSHRQVRARNKKTNKNIQSVSDSPPVIQEPVSTTTLAPTSPIPIVITDAPTQSDYSQNYESSDNTNDEEDDIPPYLFSDEDRFGSRISKSAQHATPLAQQLTQTQPQPSSLLSAQLSVQESQSSYPAATLTSTQPPSRIGVGHFQQLPHGLNTGGSNIQFPQSARNILPQPQAQLQNIPNTPYQQNYGVHQQIPLEQNRPKQVQHSAIAYNQETANQNQNNFRNQFEKTPAVTQQIQPPTSLLPAGQQTGHDLQQKQTEDVPKRQRGRRRKSRQRTNRNRQSVGRKVSSNEQQTPVKEVETRIPQYQQQYGGGQIQNPYPPQQPLQNIPPNLNNRPSSLQTDISYPTNPVPGLNLQSNVNPQQPTQNYAHGNDPSQYFTRNSNPQKNHLSITPNLVSYPEVTTKPSISYTNNRENTATKLENTPHQAIYNQPQPQQHHSQYNAPLNSQNNYQNSPPHNYPSSYNNPPSANAPSFVPNNTPQSQNPSLYTQDSSSHRNVGNYRPDLSQQSSAYEVSGIQQNQRNIPQQSSLSTEEDKPIPSLSQGTTPSPRQEVTTVRSTNRSRFGQRRKGRGRSRQPKSRSRNVVKEEKPQGQQETAHSRGHSQSSSLQQGHPNNPQPVPHVNQPFNQQFNPAYNSPVNEQQIPSQNAGYNVQTESKAKQPFLQQAPPSLNSYGRQQQQQPQQQYNTSPQQYNNAPQQIPNYHNVQKQTELGATLPSNGQSPQVPYHNNYGQQQLPIANAPQQTFSNVGNNPYPFQSNYGQGNLQTAQGNYQDTLQPNGDSQFYKRADAEDATDDYAEDEVDDEEYDN